MTVARLRAAAALAAKARGRATRSFITAASLAAVVSGCALMGQHQPPSTDYSSAHDAYLSALRTGTCFDQAAALEKMTHFVDTELELGQVVMGQNLYLERCKYPSAPVQQRMMDAVADLVERFSARARSKLQS